jgi:hypothetical protein
MTFQQGQWVRHPVRPDWGIGEVLGQEGEAVRVFFQQAGEKKLNTQFVSLEVVEAPADLSNQRPGINARPTVDMRKLEGLCLQFHEEMKDNRRGYDDGGMGLNVLRDMSERGGLTRATRQQLFAWCHTEGSVFQRGVDLAQQICREVYGRVPTSGEV